MENDPEEFRDRWNSYVKGLGRLRLSATDQETADQVKEAREQLEDAIETIARQHE